MPVTSKGAIIVNYERAGAGDVDHLYTTKSNSTRSVAAHPFDKLRAGSCKKRKDGAPTVGMAHAKIVKGGPPATLRVTKRLA